MSLDEAAANTGCISRSKVPDRRDELAPELSTQTRRLCSVLNHSLQGTQAAQTYLKKTDGDR